MLDEQLIQEVQNHAVIYNRQKYFINSSDPKKYLSKEDAWQEIAFKLNSDVETCKKRWKYLRERYVQQRKQGDPPNYEHLSRPYLDKMKFLDKHIQSRKSYKQVSNFLSSPNAHGSFTDGLMDSSRSNGSLVNISGYHNNYRDNKFIKEELQATFHSFTSDLSSSSQNQASQTHRSYTTQQQPKREFLSTNTSPKRQNTSNNYNNSHMNNINNSGSNDINYRNGELCHISNCPPSSSSSLKSIKSPLSSPQEHNNDQIINTSVTNEAGALTNELKRPRFDIRTMKINQNDSKSSDNDEDEDDNEDCERNNLLPNLANEFHNLNGRILHNSNHHSDLFAMFQQQFTQHQQQNHHHQSITTSTPLHHQSLSNSIKCSEQLLGELVTSELLKMTQERQKVVQRKILEILFFDD